MHRTPEKLVKFNSDMTGGMQINLHSRICIYTLPSLYVNNGSVSTEKSL